MSIAFDPNETTPVCFYSDDGKPEDSRPTFDARFATARERAKIRKLADDALALLQAGKDGDEEKAVGLAKQALAMQIIGWKNVVDAAGAPIPFDIGEFDAIGTITELLRLIWRTFYRTTVVEMDRPLSGGSQALPVANSASTAPQA